MVTLAGIEWCCSNCGSPAISPPTIQRGIGGEMLLGLCLTCSPQIPTTPKDDDHSARAEKTRRSITVKTQVRAYRSKLTALVPLAEYQPRVKPKPAMPASLWDDDLTGV